MNAPHKPILVLGGTGHYIPLAIVRLVSLLIGAWSPYVRHMCDSIILLNNFPQDLALGAAEDHRRLIETFDFSPTTFEEDIRNRHRSCMPV